MPCVEGIVRIGGQIDHVGTGIDLKQPVAQIEAADLSQFNIQKGYIYPVHLCVSDRFHRPVKACNNGVRYDFLQSVQTVGDIKRNLAQVTPEKDGKWLPVDPYEAYANGAAKDIEILQGCNKDESNYYLHTFGAVEPAVAFLDTVIKRKMAEMTEIPIESYTWLRFLHDDIEKVARANLVATIVDEEEVYKG